MKAVYLVIGLLISHLAFSQDIKMKLANAVASLEKDPQFKHASLSMYVMDSKSGKPVYEKNAELGMAPASTQKVITSVTAFELLGKDFRYNTFLTGDAVVKDNTLNGNLHISGLGDPTLGSWRWVETKPENILQRIYKILSDNKIKSITGNIYVDDLNYDNQPIPDHWIWQDIGNYFGAGVWAINWHENQYELHLRSGNEGEMTSIIRTYPIDLKDKIKNFITAGKKGSGDNAYIYAAPYSTNIYTSGTIPEHSSDFVISGSIPDPPKEFALSVHSYLTEKHVVKNKEVFVTSEEWNKGNTTPGTETTFGSIDSPTLDSMNYWFLKKSLNLYGEAFVKAIATKSNLQGSTAGGIKIIRDFWSTKGIESNSLKVLDGSGLSPSNRITTKALVQVLKYAKTRPWYQSFYNALPDMNGIKMKDGYIGGVRAYTGYVKSKAGVDYTFAFIVNNFDGSPGTVREKMYKVLDLLK